MLRVSRTAGVAYIVLDRPALRNALNAEMLDELRTTLGALEQDAAIRVVVLAGEGPAFSAGADLGWMRRMRAAGYKENLTDAESAGAVFHALYSLPKPVVARVHGAAIGGGVGLVAACDLVIASSDAKFAFSEVRLGIVPALIAPYVVARVGVARARALFLSGVRLSADEALRLGLVDQVVPPGELDSAVDATVASLREGGPSAQGLVKTLVAHAAAGPTPEVRRFTAELIAKVRVSPEGQEGIDAFLEKRQPHWRRSE